MKEEEGEKCEYYKGLVGNLATIMGLQAILIRLIYAASKEEKLEGIPVSCLDGSMGAIIEELNDEIARQQDMLEVKMPGIKRMFHLQKPPIHLGVRGSGKI